MRTRVSSLCLSLAVASALALCMAPPVLSACASCASVPTGYDCLNACDTAGWTVEDCEDPLHGDWKSLQLNDQTDIDTSADRIRLHLGKCSAHAIGKCGVGSTENACTKDGGPCRAAPSDASCKAASSAIKKPYGTAGVRYGRYSFKMRVIRPDVANCAATNNAGFITYFGIREVGSGDKHSVNINMGTREYHCNSGEFWRKIVGFAAHKGNSTSHTSLTCQEYFHKRTDEMSWDPWTQSSNYFWMGFDLCPRSGGVSVRYWVRKNGADEDDLDHWWTGGWLDGSWDTTEFQVYALLRLGNADTTDPYDTSTEPYVDIKEFRFPTQNIWTAGTCPFTASLCTD